MTSNAAARARAGGSFLIENHPAAEMLTPERFPADLKMMAATVRQFVEREILPDLGALEGLDYDLIRDRLRKAGEQGLLGVDVAEEYGGLAASKTATLLVAEKLAPSGSFSVTFNAHSSIGTLPLAYFGDDEQKSRYLPGLVSGELVGAYCLTEPGSGSDARSARTKAVPSEDGSTYRLTGSKMWITNAGFADLFTVFAQVPGADGPQFTAFLVERDTPGVSFGEEEAKMGIKGSSTRLLLLEDAPVPAANVLGEVGQGHRIAFSILNVGRLKLAAGAVGGVKEMLRLSADYASERQQFGVPIASFGLIREKLGRMAADCLALESAVYRIGGELDRLAEEKGPQGALEALNEYVVEYSIAKVWGSEILDEAIDETLQIHGGNGYSAEYPVEAAYRNSRINRIFEGTNEINRLLVSGQLLRRALSGRLDLVGAGQRALQGPLPPPENVPQELRDAFTAVEGLKGAALLLATAGAGHYAQGIEEEQELLARIADVTALAFLAESGLLRAQSLQDGANGQTASLLARLYALGAVDRARVLAAEGLRRIPGGADMRAVLEGHLPEMGEDLIGLRRLAADAVLERGGYPLG